MIKAAIEKILDLAKIEQFEIAGRKYTSAGVIPVKEPVPATLKVHTLSGIVDYIKEKVDPLDAGDYFLHVYSPTQVSLYGAFKKTSFCERPEFLEAIFDPPAITQGQYTSLENFIIGLQAFFVSTENRAELLKLIGNIKDENVTQFDDDGVTQAVTAKASISMVKLSPVPNPVRLRPYRTFPEVEQPESIFVFRMRKNDGDMPACGLWEADNKLWKVEAVKSIAAWLHKELPDVPIIA